jgi:hypothetical protein
MDRILVDGPAGLTGLTGFFQDCAGFFMEWGRLAPTWIVCRKFA